MAEVISFVDYTPPRRFDSIAWTDVRIEEATAATGTYAEIETITFDTPDADPANPQARDFTTELGTDVGLWYRVIFVDGDGDESLPTTPIQNVASGATSVMYADVDELKEILRLQSTDFADLAIGIACTTASRAIDGYKHTRYYPTDAETRYYTADPGDTSIRIDDLVSLDSLTVDLDDDGTYETAWTAGTEFRLEPVNAPADGQPYNRVSLRNRGGGRFPTTDDAIRIVGTFGWAEAPIQVKQAAILLANRFLVRTRQAPLDVLVAVSGETVSLAHLGNIDKDAKFLLDELPGRSPIRSLQLT